MKLIITQLLFLWSDDTLFHLNHSRNTEMLVTEQFIHLNHSRNTEMLVTEQFIHLNHSRNTEMLVTEQFIPLCKLWLPLNRFRGKSTFSNFIVYNFTQPRK